MSWTPLTTGIAELLRGCEWYIFEGDKISEIRSYHNNYYLHNEKNRELWDFDYIGRGYRGEAAAAAKNFSPRKNMMSELTPRTYRLIISCPDKVGIVARVTQFIAEYDGSLMEANNHTDMDSQWFFMRCVISAESLKCSLLEFEEYFSPVADEYSMKWYIRDSMVKQKVVLLASHASHCLADLLYRWHSGELDCDIPCVISNHENLRSMVEWHGIPFHHVIVDKNNRDASFQKWKTLLSAMRQIR